MRPCFYCTKISEFSDSIICPYKDVFDYSLKGKAYLECRRFKECQKFCELARCKETHTSKFRKADTIVNMSSSGKVEIVKHIRTFSVPLANSCVIERSPNWINVNGLLVASKDDVCVDDYIENQKRSGLRAVKNLYNMIEENCWDYFITLTFSQKFLNRLDDKEIKYRYNLFSQKFRRFDKNLKMLCVGERHENGALHFHIVANCKSLPIVTDSCMEETFSDNGDYNHIPKSEFKYFMFPIVENGKYKKTKAGEPFFALSFFNLGRNFTGIMDRNDTSAAVNYISKYVSKSSCKGSNASKVGYGQKRFFATQNIAKRVSLSVKYEDISDEFKDKVELIREKKKINIYRNYNIPKDGEEK